MNEMTASHTTLTRCASLQAFIADEFREENRRRAEWERDVREHSGVTLGGLGPGPFLGRSDLEIRIEAARKKANLEAWKSSDDGRLVENLNRADQLLLALAQTLDSARSARLRGLHSRANSEALRRLLDEALSASSKLTKAVHGASEATERMAVAAQ